MYKNSNKFTLLLPNIPKIPTRFFNLLAPNVPFCVLPILFCDEYVDDSESVFDKSSNGMAVGGVKPDLYLQ